ncbi:MAG: GNAT family N-acetyltransferase [Rubrivivax sp.]|nr:GNAT family N-acetyltransferase [Rubrivivax sp.]
MHLRPLTAADAAAYRELMLEAYVQAADAFTSTAGERMREPGSWWVRRIADPAGLGIAFGAWDGELLAGTVGLEFSAKPKTRHAALVLGMYVRPAARGRGIARALLDAAIAHAASRPGTRVLTLTVTEGNDAAIRLYGQAGFRAWGTEPMAIATPSGYKGKVHMWRAIAAGEGTAGGPIAGSSA